MIKKIKIVGIILILVGAFLPLSSFVFYKVEKYQTEVFLDQKITDEKYYAVLEIDAIDLKKELYPVSSKENNVDQNILVHEESIMPGNGHSNLILASHSGQGRHAYFQDLYLLSIHDEIKLYYEGNIWVYEILEIEYQDKTGILYLKEDYSDMITLITCTEGDSDRQTIYYGVLKKTINI